MNPDRDEGRTDPRILRTRKSIEDAFLAVMNEKGFEDLSVQDVAEQAGINRVTFYAHFPDKYALLAESIRKSFTEELEKRNLVRRGLTAGSVGELFAAACAYVAALRGHCKPPHRHLDWTLEQEITGYCADSFCRWADAERKANAERPFRMSAAAAAGAMYALVLEWLADERRASPETYVASALPIVTEILKLP